MDVGAQITYYRTLKGMSVNKLANKSGVSQSYLRDVELGNKNPTVIFLSTICESLDITLVDFFSEENSINIENYPLIQRIYKLSPEQRKTLLQFLNTI